MNNDYSLLRRIKSEGLDIQSPGQNVDEYVYSEETPLYDPASDWLQSLPAWDGTNHVAELFGRIPGVTTEQHHLLAGRPIYGRAQKCRLRYDSFVSTTNNPRPLLIDNILKEILAEFPSIRTTEGIHVRLGKVLKAQNFERKRITQGSAYYVVSRKTAA